jgi:hypothetical protein
MFRTIANRLTARLGVTVAGAACICGLAPAIAQACPSAATSQPFARFGDTADYVPVPGGSFESGGKGWSLGEASIVNENESYDVAGGSHSLEIKPGGTTVSPTVCVNSIYPTMRLFARQMPSQYNWGVLEVSVRWTNAEGKTQETVVGSTQGETSWQPTQILNFGAALPIWSGSPDMSAQLVFKAYAGGSAWEIDDVYVDPYSR